MEDRESQSRHDELLRAVLAIGSDLELEPMLHRIVESAVALVGARYGALAVLDEEGVHLDEFVSVGVSEAMHQEIGRLPEGHGILGLLIADPRPLRLRDLRAHPESFGFPRHHPPMRSFLGVPIKIRAEVFGNLYLTDKVDADEFSAVDEQLAVGLASAAAVAIDNARMQTQLQSLVVMHDRERIARDLHDNVIQRLFATGLFLQATAGVVGDDRPVAERIEQAVDDLDVTIDQIRSAIFGLSTSTHRGDGLRDRTLALLDESAAVLGFEPRVVFDGPVDAAVTEPVAADLLATLREALTNVARHANAGRVDVSLTASDDVVLTVVDDGLGARRPVTTRGRGLGNMATRATRHHGTMHVDEAPSGGTVVTWRIPTPHHGRSPGGDEVAGDDDEHLPG